MKGKSKNSVRILMIMLHNFSLQEVRITYSKSKVNTSLFTSKPVGYLWFIVDSVTGDKRYIPNFNVEQIDQRLSSILTSKIFFFSSIKDPNGNCCILDSLNTLNKSVKSPGKRMPTVRQESKVQSSTNTPQSRSKRTSARKQN